MKGLLSRSTIGGAALILFIILAPLASNAQLGLKSLMPGMLMGQILALPLLAHGRKFRHGITSRFLVIYALVAAFMLINAIWVGSSLSNLLILLGLIIVVAVNGSLIADRVSSNPYAAREIVMLSYFVLLALGLHKIALQRSHILFVGEPSFYALITGPIALILYSLNRKMGLVNLLILFGCAALLPNATFALFGLIQLGWLVSSRRLSFILIPFLLVLAVGLQVYATEFGNGYFRARFTLDVNYANLSSLMFMANWVDIWHRLLEFQFFGDGVGGRAAYLQLRGAVAEQAVQRYGDYLTYNSGTFWFARAMQTVGFVSIIVIIAAALRAWASLREAMRNRKLSASGHLTLVLISSMLPELFFRGASLVGYSSVLFFIAMRLPRQTGWDVSIGEMSLKAKLFRKNCA